MPDGIRRTADFGMVQEVSGQAGDLRMTKGLGRSYMPDRPKPYRSNPA